MVAFDWTHITPLLGVVIGAYGTYLVNSRIENKKIKNDTFKEKKNRIEELYVRFSRVLEYIYKINESQEFIDINANKRVVFELDMYIKLYFNHTDILEKLEEFYLIENKIRENNNKVEHENLNKDFVNIKNNIEKTILDEFNKITP